MLLQLHSEGKPSEWKIVAQKRESDTSLVVELFTAAYSVLTLQRQRHWRRLKQSVKSFLFILLCSIFPFSCFPFTWRRNWDLLDFAPFCRSPFPRLKNVIVATVDDWAENSIDLFFSFRSLTHSFLLPSGELSKLSDYKNFLFAAGTESWDLIISLFRNHFTTFPFCCRETADVGSELTCFFFIAFSIT